MRKFPHEVDQLDTVRGKIILSSSNESHAILDFSTVFVVEGPRRLRPVVVRGQAVCQVGCTSTTHDDVEESSCRHDRVRVRGLVGGEVCERHHCPNPLEMTSLYLRRVTSIMRITLSS